MVIESIVDCFSIFSKLILRLMMIDLYTWVVTKNVLMDEWVLEPALNDSQICIYWIYRHKCMILRSIDLHSQIATYQLIVCLVIFLASCNSKI